MGGYRNREDGHNHRHRDHHDRDHHDRDHHRNRGCGSDCWNDRHNLIDNQDRSWAGCNTKCCYYNAVKNASWDPAVSTKENYMRRYHLKGLYKQECNSHYPYPYGRNGRYGNEDERHNYNRGIGDNCDGCNRCGY